MCVSVSVYRSQNAEKKCASIGIEFFLFYDFNIEKSNNKLCECTHTPYSFSTTHRFDFIHLFIVQYLHNIKANAIL